MFNFSHDGSSSSTIRGSPDPGMSSNFEHTPMSQARNFANADFEHTVIHSVRAAPNPKSSGYDTVVGDATQPLHYRSTSIPRLSSLSEPRYPHESSGSPFGGRVHRRNATTHEAALFSVQAIKPTTSPGPGQIPCHPADTGWDVLQTTDLEEKSLHRQEMFARKGRELYMGLVGVQIVFMYANFVFLNFSGAIIALFGCFGAVYAHCDRRISTYVLSGSLQLLIGLVVSLGVATELTGFSAYRENSHLRAISIAHVPASFFLALLAAFLARVEYVRPSQKACPSEYLKSPIQSEQVVTEDEDENPLVVRVAAPSVLEPSSFVHTPSSLYCRHSERGTPAAVQTPGVKTQVMQPPSRSES